MYVLEQKFGLFYIYHFAAAIREEFIAEVLLMVSQTVVFGITLSDFKAQKIFTLNHIDCKTKGMRSIDAVTEMMKTFRVNFTAIQCAEDVGRKEVKTVQVCVFVGV